MTETLRKTSNSVFVIPKTSENVGRVGLKCIEHRGEIASNI